VLNHNQRRFVVQMMSSPTKKEAAEELGLMPRTTYNWPPEVDIAIENIFGNIQQAAIQVLADNVLRASLVKIAGMDSTDEKIRQLSSFDIMDRVLGKALQPVTNDIALRVDGLEDMLAKVYGDDDAA